MAQRPKVLAGLMISSALALTALGLSGIAASADTAHEAAKAPTSASAGGHKDHRSGHTMAASTRPALDDPDGDGYVSASAQVQKAYAGKKAPKAAADAPPHRYFHEFQANCSVSHARPDDPIVFPGQPGKSHDHTFMGNTTTDAHSTTESLDAGGTLCKAPGDRSGYWMPTLYNGDKEVRPVGPQTIYYKAGVTDYTSVHPFPKGLRFLVGNPMQSAEEFRDHPGMVEGWECGESYHNVEFPSSCPTAQDVQLNIRLQAPSCWDGKNLDTPDHTSHMAYPYAQGANENVCPSSHPVALPMVEFKMAWPVNGDMSEVRLASGTGHSFHYDFFNAWDDDTLAAMVNHCIVGGLQCDARGYDETHPEEGAALNEDYELP